MKEKVTEITKEEADNITNPRPTKEQLIAKAEYDKQALITEVQAEPQLLQTKLALGRISDNEKARLNAWLDYLEELEAVDVSTAPDIIWPVKPVV
ncbi:phage tail protein [Shigella sonnei]|nr:phage tail protein [Shigella sonnei]